MTFNEIYWASKSPTILAMMDQVRENPNAGPIIVEGFAQILARQGKTDQANLIDVPIMAWLWDPYILMQMRKQYGYAWVPSALTPPVQVAPGIVVPGMPSYDPNNPPPQSIKVSVDVADYPAYTASVSK